MQTLVTSSLMSSLTVHVTSALYVARISNRISHVDNLKDNGLCSQVTVDPCQAQMF